MSFLNPYTWRWLHALNDCLSYPHIPGERYEEFHIDVGYCLDRYSIEYEDGSVRSIP